MNMSLINKSLWVGAIALTLGAGSTFAGGKGIKVGDALPELSAFGLEGKLPDDLKGKVVLLDFWASWCGPCEESFPVMDGLHQKYGAKGLVILAVNVDESAAEMNAFLKEHPVKFVILHDAKKKLVRTVNIASMPTSLTNLAFSLSKLR